MERAWSLLHHQHGLARTRQLYELGMSRGRLRVLVEKGVLQRVHFGVVRVAGAPKSRKHDLMLGILLGGPISPSTDKRAAIARATAAVLHDLTEDRVDRVHVLTTRRIAEVLEGFEFHFTSRLPATEVAEVDGIPVTDAIRTFIDLCGVQPYRAVPLFRRGLRKKLFTPESVIQRLDEESRQGRAGLRAARQAVELTDPSAAMARSALEDHYFDLLVSLGYPPPQRNALLPGSYGHPWQVDLWFPQVNFGFEISPYDTHGTPEAIDRDVRKELDLEAQGYRVRRISDGISDLEFAEMARRLLGPPDQFPRSNLAL